MCISVVDFNPKTWIYFYPSILSIYRLLQAVKKLMLLLWKYPEETETHIFGSTQRLFLNILYITGAVRQTGGTKRIFQPLQKSPVQIYVHRLFRSIQVLRTHFQNGYFYTNTQKYSIMQYMLTSTYNMWAWIQLSLKTGFSSWKEIKFWASVQIIRSFCNANWRKSFLHD